MAGRGVEVSNLVEKESGLLWKFGGYFSGNSWGCIQKEGGFGELGVRLVGYSSVGIHGVLYTHSLLPSMLCWRLWVDVMRCIGATSGI